MTDQRYTLVRNALAELEAQGVPFNEAVLETIKVAAAAVAVSLGSRATANRLREIAAQLEDQIPDETHH